MNVMVLHHVGVPCVCEIEKNPVDITGTGERVLYRNPKALVRFEPHGATIVPPDMYAYSFYADEELASLLKQSTIHEHDLSADIVSLLLQNRIILERPTDTSYIQDVHVDQKGLPLEVLLDVTSECDCACLACYHIQDLNGFRPPLKELLLRIDHLAFLGVCLFEVTGGEAFLREDLEDILAHIAKLGLHYYVVTNSARISAASPSLLHTLGRGLGVAVSLDGIGAVHDRIRRHEGLYDKVVTGMQILSEHRIPTYLVATIHQGNVDQIGALVSFSERFDTMIHLRPFKRTGNAARNRLSRILPSKISVQLAHPHVLNGFLSTTKKMPVARFYGCDVRTRISVSANGLVYPCVMDRSRSLERIESYDRSSILNALQRETSRCLAASNKCSDCTFRCNASTMACGGFCRFSCSYAQERR
jgi:MoaA/NifB/PqqE/SkfB family radical SAM enzyme